MAEFYKTATITGAVPQGHPISLQVWQHKPAVTEFGTPTVLATDVGAMQGVARGGGFYFTTSGTSAAPANNRQIRTYNSSWVLQHTRDTALDFGSHAQVNGLFVDGSKLYAGANNHNTQPSAGWVLEYNIEANGSLTFVAAHSIGNMWTEGCAKHDGSWFVVGHDRHEIWQFDLSWNLIEVHSLPGTSPGDATGNLYQGIRFIGDVALLNLHGGNANSPRMDTYKWTGEGFAEALLNIKPPTDCTQGFHVSDDGLTMLWARRNSNGSMNPADVVSTPIINGAEGVGLGLAAADFSDVRITDAAGNEIPAWIEHYVEGRTAWLHFANPAAITTSADFRVYYGSGVPATRTDALGIGAIKYEDFESGRGAFVNNYNAGDATTVAGAGLNGSAALSVTGTAGDGVYSNSGEFMRPSLVRLVGWIKPASGVLGEVHFMAPTGSGSNQRRGNLQFNNTSVQARSNNVVQPAFASGLASLTWRRYEIEFDFAASRYGAKIFDETGVRRGHAPRSTYQTVDSAPVYRDVMAFRQQHTDRIFSLPMLADEPVWGAWSAETATGTVHEASAVLSGSGVATAYARISRSAAALLAGTSTLTATATTSSGQQGAASLVGTGMMSATARVLARTSSSLTGISILTGFTHVARRATAAMTAQGQLTARARTQYSLTVSFSGTGYLTATGYVVGDDPPVHRAVVSVESRNFDPVPVSTRNFGN